jgi:transcriptional regulator with XRE-family HTH domain
LLSLEVGQRCRRFRNVLGISQQKLADMVGTTPQNISKYEKEGIHDVDVIRSLSNALGHDLMTDESDEEGAVGEIVKEILDILVNNEDAALLDGHTGCIETSRILGRESLYGLPEKRIVREMFKLEKIGLCVREQYIDFYGMEKDKVFITAKGVITLKHIGAFKNQLGDYRNVCTYEMLCQGYDSYQEYIDSEQM